MIGIPGSRRSTPMRSFTLRAFGPTSIPSTAGEGLAEFWRRMHAAWEEFRIDIEQMDEEGDRFVLALRFRGTGVGSGVDVDLKFANSIRIRERLQVEVFSRRTVEEARAALQERQPTAGS
jgi:hypothetical protein